MKMGLQRANDQVRDAPATQEEGSERPLDVYGPRRHSEVSPKNDSALDHRHDTPCENAADPNIKCRSSRFPRSRGPPRSSPSPSRRAPSPSLETMHIPSSLTLGAREHRLLHESTTLPPVTKQTLSELDLPCIRENIHLRIDANFDRDLSFKVNLDGERGKRKIREAADYWESVAVEIYIYQYNVYYGHEDLCSDGFDCTDLHQTFVSRLPAMLETLRDILKTLVPERDHPRVIQNLDISLLMQQIRKGVLDMVGLANWLAALLKTHCAPMRDALADQMVDQISVGSQSQNPTGIVYGLRNLFGILESMKLDVANHQIRVLRVLLVEDTVPFLQEYFQDEIKRDNLEVESSRSWYLELRGGNMNRSADSFWPVSVMFQGLAELLLQFDHPGGFPQTFVFDSDRLWQLRAILQNLINADISWYIFESCVHTQKRYLDQAEIYSTFQSRIWPLMEQNEDYHRGSLGWRENVRCIALEMARCVCAACNDKDVVLDKVIGPIEAAMEWHLSNNSELFQYFQSSMQEKLLKATCHSANKYLNMSPIAICESQRSFLPPSMPERDYNLEHIAVRLAHIGVLHWRVWAPILYLSENVPKEADSDIPMESLSSV